MAAGTELSTSEVARGYTRHGMCGTPEYWAWTGMRARCTNPRSKRFSDYGGRGIRVCDEWRTFSAFLRDMGLRPSSQHSIDRIDVNGNYEPSNCRWATIVEQNRNSRQNVLLQHEGELLTASEWADRKGMRVGTLLMRLTHGWTVERAIETPVRMRAKR